MYRYDQPVLKKKKKKKKKCEVKLFMSVYLNSYIQLCTKETYLVKIAQCYFVISIA